LPETTPFWQLIAIFVRKPVRDNINSTREISEKCMRSLREFRSGKPDFYPDQAVYAEFACAELGLTFSDLDGGTGFLVRVASRAKSVQFGAGRCSWYPQNNATASTLASDKFFTNKVLEDAGIPTLGGEYFFLHDRHRAYRPAGRDRADALAHFSQLGMRAFVKPLQGSRGDFAQALHDEAAFARYLDEVSKYYDAILIQPIFSGTERRVFLLDDEVVYSARKHPPFVIGDGVHTLGELLVGYDEMLQARGLSPVAIASEASLRTVPAKGERCDIPGRTNLSAGGTMAIEAHPSPIAVGLARDAIRALGLRVAAVDLFTDIDEKADGMRVIEVNANPSIRLLEESGREDLILKIWRHTLSAMGILSV
jgi:D-alanine-D-alanine ligase-like ATP-grasp enzyme